VTYRNTVALVILSLVLVAGCTRTERASGPVTAPDFTLKDLNGKSVRLADLKGKVVLVEFWATWCGPCQASIPGLERLHRAYSGKGLVVLGVSVDGGEWDLVRSFAAEKGMTYAILQGDEEVSNSYRVRAIPATFLVNKDGMIAKQYLGEAFEADMERDIRSLL